MRLKNMIFLLDLEDDLADTVLTFANRGFPFKPPQLCLLAFEMNKRARRKGFSPIKLTAGRYWLRGFLQRHKKLKKKNNTNLNISRAISANKKQIDGFFDMFKNMVDQWDLEWHPNYIWNVDECGVPDIPDDGNVVIGEVGKRAMTTVGGEKGINTTVLTYISAGGMHAPPMILFKGSRMNHEWADYAPTGYMIRTTKSGYISADTFAAYGERFIQVPQKQEYAQAKGENI